MPAMFGTVFVGAVGAPLITPKYAVAYPLATDDAKPRSIAYLTSADGTSRLTGGLNLIPCLIFTVIVRPFFDTVGIAAARSGTGVTLFGLYASIGRCVTYFMA